MRMLPTMAVAAVALVTALCAATVHAQEGPAHPYVPDERQVLHRIRDVVRGLTPKAAEFPPFDSAAFDGEPVVLDILSGSESRDVLDAIGPDLRHIGVALRIDGTGSWDIEYQLTNSTLRERYDVFTPGSSNWLTAGLGSSSTISSWFSAGSSPVVLSVKKSTAESLGWTGAPPTWANIQQAVSSGSLVINQTSGCHSNTGFLWALAMLTAENGGKSPSPSDLRDPNRFPLTRAYLYNVESSSSSTGYLAVSALQKRQRYQAWVNYEYHVLAVNAVLAELKEEPYVMIYPREGTLSGDLPFGLRAGVPADKQAAFNRLKAYLTSKRGQARVASVGRRTLIGGDCPIQFMQLYAQGTDGGTTCPTLTTFAFPSPATGAAFMQQYASAWQRPSLTIYVVGYGETMRGERAAQLSSAWNCIIGTDAQFNWMTPGAHDVTVVIPYSDGVWTDRTQVLVGNDKSAATKFIESLRVLEPSGGNAYHRALKAAIAKASELKAQYTPQLPAPLREKGFRVAVVLLTDEVASDDTSVLEGVTSDVSVHAAGFGRARPEDLHALTARFGGRCVGADRGVTRALIDLGSMNK